MAQDKITLDAVSAMDQAAFVATFGNVFELSPWVAEQAWAARPFGSIDALLAAMMQAVRAADPDAVRVLLERQPELARPGALSAASAMQPGGPPLLRLKPGEGAQLAAYDREYFATFGYHFIMDVRGLRELAPLLAAIDQRVANDPDTERETALTELSAIARSRIWDLVQP